jgi:hypothetical protein
MSCNKRVVVGAACVAVAANQIYAPGADALMKKRKKAGMMGAPGAPGAPDMNKVMAGQAEAIGAAKEADDKMKELEARRQPFCMCCGGMTDAQYEAEKEKIASEFGGKAQAAQGTMTAGVMGGN